VRRRLQQLQQLRDGVGASRCSCKKYPQRGRAIPPGSAVGRFVVFDYDDGNNDRYRLGHG